VLRSSKQSVLLRTAPARLVQRVRLQSLYHLQQTILHHINRLRVTDEISRFKAIAVVCIMLCSTRYVKNICLMMEAVRTSETSVDNHFTRQYNPEVSSEHHTRRRENLKSHLIYVIFSNS
jgi:hypothetical protein